MIRRLTYAVAGVLLAYSLLAGAVVLVRSVWGSGVTPPADVLVLRNDIEVTSLPVRLKIPSLSIDAHVQHVGTTQQGNMAAPSNFSDVGWYKHGTVPGMAGSAVIDGHVDNALALPGVFEHLAYAKVGDDIYIETVDGKNLHFRVRAIEVYPYKEVPAKYVFEKTNEARLNLITCDGTWIAGEKTYDKRLIVYAIRVE